MYSFLACFPSSADPKAQTHKYQLLFKTLKVILYAYWVLKIDFLFYMCALLYAGMYVYHGLLPIEPRINYQITCKWNYR